MAKIEFKGIAEYVGLLERISSELDKTAKKALYNGAAAVADDVRAAIEALPTEEWYGTEEHPAHGIRPGQKQALLEGLGVAPFQETGDRIDTLVGFTGYSDYKTRKYPNGQPLVLIARVAESGTSFSEKTPFFAKSIRRIRPEAEQIMKRTFEEEIEKIMKE